MAKLTVIKSGKNPMGFWALVSQNYKGLKRIALINPEKQPQAGKLIEVDDEVIELLNWKYGG